MKNFSFLVFYLDFMAVGAINRVILMNFGVAFSLSFAICSHPRMRHCGGIPLQNIEKSVQQFYKNLKHFIKKYNRITQRLRDTIKSVTFISLTSTFSQILSQQIFSIFEFSVALLKSDQITTESLRVFHKEKEIITKAYICRSLSLVSKIQLSVLRLQDTTSCLLWPVACYGQCQDTTTSLLTLQFYTYSASICHWSYHETGCTMQTYKCWTRPYLAKWAPVVGHWLF